MRLTRRRFGALAIAGGATVLLSACNQSSNSGSGSAPAAKTAGGNGGGGSVAFVTALAEDERQVVSDLLKTFESNAGVQVKMIQMESQDVVNQLKAKKAANKVDIDLVAQDNLKNCGHWSAVASWRI